MASVVDQACRRKKRFTLNSHKFPAPDRWSRHSSAGMNFYTFNNARSVARPSSTAQGTEATWLPTLQRPTPAQDSSLRHAPRPWRRKRCLMLFSLAMGVCLCVPSAIALFVYHQSTCHSTTPQPKPESEQREAATAVPEAGFSPAVHPGEPPSSCSGASSRKPAEVALTCMRHICLAASTHPTYLTSQCGSAHDRT